MRALIAVINGLAVVIGLLGVIASRKVGNKPAALWAATSTLWAISNFAWWLR